MNDKLTARLYSDTAPSAEQEAKLSALMSEKYGRAVTIEWICDGSVRAGFRLEIAGDVWDWTTEGRLRQLKREIDRSSKDGGVISLLRDGAKSWRPLAMSEEMGRVLSVGDGIAVVEGLDEAFYGEILLFDGGVRGMVQRLGDETVGCILFENGGTVSAGSAVYRTGKLAGIPCGDEFLGRVVDALGATIDGGPEIVADAYRPAESPAPGIIDRAGVCEPLETGILAIDSMFPIGRGQRELIIGDRQTGKTAIAVDTIINQKDKNVICIYVAIGQKASSVASLVHTLREHDAMKYTTVVCASAADPASLQYIAPYAGCAMGEHFMEKGYDVLIVYDDLSKHAIAYRTLSLLLGRSPGREAYPGDVFYLHSRLLERAAHLSEEKGGGSMTALPIVETQAGDVSAYIPTNIISITDGQLFLESDLFYSGQRPAINVGISVSRVGGRAQAKSMRSATGSLRLALAQYREMEVFTQFSGDLDETTRRELRYGEGLMRLLRQPRSSPMPMHAQVISLVAASAHVFEDVERERIRDFAAELVSECERNHAELCRLITMGARLTDENRQEIVSAAQDTKKRFA